MKKDSYYWINKLGLKKHPEGGYFKETYRSSEIIKANALPERFTGPRSIFTAIYFLLKGDDISRLHRLKSDELWHFYTGSSLTLHIIDQKGKYSRIHLGDEPEKGEVFQTEIKNGQWLAATVDNKKSYSLVGCTVSPGFDFHDFELADRNKFLLKYPELSEIIKKLTR